MNYHRAGIGGTITTIQNKIPLNHKYYLRRVEAAGTAGLIDNSGLNHVIDNCKNIRCVIRYRVRGFIMRNCTGSSTFNFTSGFLTGNTVKVENNNLTGIVYGVTGYDYLNFDKTLFMIKNNNINCGLAIDKKVI